MLYYALPLGLGPRGLTVVVVLVRCSPLQYVSVEYSRTMVEAESSGKSGSWNSWVIDVVPESQILNKDLPVRVPLRLSAPGFGRELLDHLGLERPMGCRRRSAAPIPASRREVL